VKTGATHNQTSVLGTHNECKALSILLLGNRACTLQVGWQTFSKQQEINVFLEQTAEAPSSCLMCSGFLCKNDSKFGSPQSQLPSVTSMSSLLDFAILSCLLTGIQQEHAFCGQCTSSNFVAQLRKVVGLRSIESCPHEGSLFADE
jgi:hypothetical protein